jgi:SM-20-related protein
MFSSRSCGAGRARSAASRTVEWRSSQSGGHPEPAGARNMPHAGFFKAFGLFAARGFLDAALCERLRWEMRSASGVPGRIWDNDRYVEHPARRTTVVDVSPGARSLVETRLLALKPALEEHFRTVLHACQPLQFLRYRTGDYYRRHPDRDDTPGASRTPMDRKVSVVIFLNDQSPQPEEGSYCGGALVFYGLAANPALKQHGLPLSGDEGAMIAFRPEIVHEVMPVEEGERFTIGTWFI